MSTEIAIRIPTAADARKGTDALKRAIGQGHRLWRQAYAEEWWRLLDHVSWNAYCVKELGVTTRTARRYVEQALAEIEGGGHVSAREAARIAAAKREAEPVDTEARDVTEPPEADREEGDTGGPEHGSSAPEEPADTDPVDEEGASPSAAPDAEIRASRDYVNARGVVPLAGAAPEWHVGSALLTVWWERPSNKLRMEVDARGLESRIPRQPNPGTCWSPRKPTLSPSTLLRRVATS